MLRKNLLLSPATPSSNALCQTGCCPLACGDHNCLELAHNLIGAISLVLRQQLVDHVSVDIGEATVNAIVTECQLFVVDS